jgi:hypothetical protein
LRACQIISFDLRLFQCHPDFAGANRAVVANDDAAGPVTFFLSYEGPLPATARPKEVKVDITIKEEIVFPLEPRKVLRAYEEYEDLPEDAAILTYSLREIASEKVVALLDAARNEPRDL